MQSLSRQYTKSGSGLQNLSSLPSKPSTEPNDPTNDTDKARPSSEPDQRGLAGLGRVAASSPQNPSECPTQNLAQQHPSMLRHISNLLVHQHQREAHIVQQVR